MALSAGDVAPDISLFDDQSTPFSLADARRSGPVVVLFFPGAFTSVCTDELNTVANDYGRYEGATVVGISTDSPFALAEFRKANSFPFRLLSDHDGATASAYHARYDHDFTPMKLDRIARRAAFVVNTDGTLAYAEVLESAGDQPDFEAVVAALGVSS